MNYVIIGNSTAAVHCVEGIRSVDRTGSIVLVSDEPHFTYGRPLISYYLYGKTDLQRMRYRQDDWYEVNGVSTRLSVRAEKIDPAQKTVLLSSGETLPYDKLLVATGSRPFVPPMAGLDGVKDKYTFLTLDDALALERDLTREDDVLVVGAGLIGLKCTEGILSRVRSVTVVDLADRVLPSVLDREGSLIVQHYLEEKGVRFFLSDSVSSFSNGSALLKSGRSLPFTKLVLAVGVRPNVELVSEAGGKCERGICCNDRQETTLPDVYAAGDCALSHDLAAGTDRVLALLPNAAFQGRTAGINMAGGVERFTQAIPMNAMGLFDLHMITAGVYEGDSYEDRTNGYKKLFVRDDRLKGFILIGDVRRAGIYTSLIRNETPLSSVDFDLIKREPCLAAFSKAERNEKLTRSV
ncbi:MAG: NAD(P)/FAD-dependent oxidoreductase [Christensenellaceae bacterium]